MLQYCSNFLLNNLYTTVIIIIHGLILVLSTDFVSAQNHLIRQFDSNSIIFAFIPGSEFRGPLYCGLPTIEQHRTNNPLLAATQLMNSGINNIIISDPYMTAKHAEQLIFMLRDRHFSLR